jgi:transcriptional regulator of acetoin/glycerol metabolism
MLSFLAGTLPDAGDRDRRVRLVAASSRDLQSMVVEETFRPDLFARLSGYEAALPPLRERREDLGLLVRAMLHDEGQAAPAMAIGAFRRILGYSWPFNLRELNQTLRAALAVSRHQGAITRASLDEVLRGEQGDQFTPGRIQSVREELLRSLRAHGADVDALAEALRCPREQIERWLQRFAFAPASYETH